MEENIEKIIQNINQRSAVPRNSNQQRINQRDTGKRDKDNKTINNRINSRNIDGKNADRKPVNNAARRRANRRKRVIIAYTLRGIVFLVAAGMIFLMICGCLYLRDLFCGKKETVEADNTYLTANVNYEAASGQAGNTVKDCEDLIIALDAGHGGNDGGTYSGDILEKDITLAVTEYMKELLEQRGATVIMTRTTDEYISLDERANMANQSAAELFVSIHCNSYEDDASIKGLECYYQKDSAEGKKLAENITGALEVRGSIESRGAKPENYYVLKHTRIPAVLIELGYLSNRSECQQLVSEEYQQKLAEELVESILQSR